MKKPRALTEFPADWTLGDKERVTFREHNPTASDTDIETQWTMFRAHHESRGDTFKLWSAAWVYWSCKAKIYGFKGTNGHQTGGMPMQRPPVPIGAVARSTWLREGGRVVEGTGLENRRGQEVTVGSNPTPPARLSPEEQRTAVRSLIAGIGNGPRR